MAHEFCRFVLADVMCAVRSHTTAEQRKAAWGWRSGHQVEFHGPDEFYWYGSGCCVWHANAMGWSAWLQQTGCDVASLEFDNILKGNAR